MGCSQSLYACPSTKDAQSFHEEFVITHKISIGRYATVHAASNIDLAGQSLTVAKDAGLAGLAVKVVDLRARSAVSKGTSGGIADTKVPEVEQEVKIMCRLASIPNVVRLVSIFRDSDLAYLAMERCECTFLEGLERLPDLTERSLAEVFRQMLQGLAAVHAVGVVHRDVKPGSFLFSQAPEQFESNCGTLKLCDFGLSVDVSGGNCQGEHGTLPFMAPEMLRDEMYGSKVDIWSFGTIAYTLFYGKFPYIGPTHRGMKAAIRIGSAKPDFALASALTGLLPNTSRDAQRFAWATLQRSPAERPTAKMILADEFLRTPAKSASEQDSGASFRPTLAAAKVIGLFGAGVGQVDMSGLDARLALQQSKHHGSTDWQSEVRDGVAQHLQEQPPEAFQGKLNRRVSSKSTDLELSSTLTDLELPTDI